MAFNIEVTETAEADINEAAEFIATDSQSAAAKWQGELWEKIFSLREMPSRFAIIPEAVDLRLTYRSIIHYSHRTIYRIDDAAKTVFVVRIYHGSRRPLVARDIY